MKYRVRSVWQQFFDLHFARPRHYPCRGRRDQCSDGPSSSARAHGRTPRRPRHSCVLAIFPFEWKYTKANRLALQRNKGGCSVRANETSTPDGCRPDCLCRCSENLSRACAHGEGLHLGRNRRTRRCDTLRIRRASFHARMRSAPHGQCRAAARGRRRRGALCCFASEAENLLLISVVLRCVSLVFQSRSGRPAKAPLPADSP